MDNFLSCGTLTECTWLQYRWTESPLKAFFATFKTIVFPWMETSGLFACITVLCSFERNQQNRGAVTTMVRHENSWPCLTYLEPAMELDSLWWAWAKYPHIRTRPYTLYGLWGSVYRRVTACGPPRPRTCTYLMACLQAVDFHGRSTGREFTL